MSKIEEKVESLVKKKIENIGYELFDVLYLKEGQDLILRIVIDNEKGITLDDCEKVNNEIKDILDEADLIQEQYLLEVSSPGIERLLRKEKHLKQNIGKEITVNLFKPINIENANENEETKSKKKKEKPKKQIDGILKDFTIKQIILNVENNELTIERKNIANMKLKYNW